VNKDGKVLGRFVPTGFMPKFFEDLSRAGISINPRIFKVESEPR
jgi:hypothetical protein